MNICADTLSSNNSSIHQFDGNKVSRAAQSPIFTAVSEGTSKHIQGSWENVSSAGFPLSTLGSSTSWKPSQRTGGRHFRCLSVVSQMCLTSIQSWAWPPTLKHISTTAFILKDILVNMITKRVNNEFTVELLYVYCLRRKTDRNSFSVRVEKKEKQKRKSWFHQRRTRPSMCSVHIFIWSI